MTEKIPHDIKKGLEEACRLHDRAVSDSEKCSEFSKTMSNLLARIEDAGSFRIADQIMTVLLNCNPKEGTHCDKATQVAEKMKKLAARLQ